MILYKPELLIELLKGVKEMRDMGHEAFRKMILDFLKSPSFKKIMESSIEFKKRIAVKQENSTIH